ncbi:MAG: FecR domain-containing protein [Candidatus Omnitrophica bacterium]|nr:FecR domain-containing protein [Candidatus Omnitrophota bacterium]
MNKRKFIAILSVVIAGLLWAEERPVISLVSKKGNVAGWNASDRRWEEIAAKSQLAVGSYLKTGKESEAVISFGKKAVVTLGSETLIKIRLVLFEQENLKHLQLESRRGRIWSAVEKLPTPEGKFEIETPNAVAGVRGTVFLVSYTPEEQASKISVISGEVGVSSRLVEGYVILKENMSTVVVANKPPISPQVLEEKERLEWEMWKQRIPFSEIGLVGAIAEINILQTEEAARKIREMAIATKGSAKVMRDFENIESAILLYYADTKNVPRRLRDLMENPGVSGWKGPYLGAGTNFMDPYGRPYQYKIMKTPKGKEYLELSTFGLIGAAGETRGEEKKIIFVDSLREKLEEKLTGARQP